MTAFRALDALLIAGASALSIGCSSAGSPASPEGPSSTGEEGAPEASASTGFDGGSTPLFDAGSTPSFDAGSSPAFDGSSPDPLDGGSGAPGVKDDAGLPALPSDGGMAICNPLEPKYAQEYLQESLSGLPTPCTSCTASECCYSLLACVPR